MLSFSTFTRAPTIGFVAGRASGIAFASPATKSPLRMERPGNAGLSMTHGAVHQPCRAPTACAIPGLHMRWGRAAQGTVLVGLLAGIASPAVVSMAIVAALGFVAGLVFPRAQHPASLDEVESLKLRLSDLENEVRSIALTGYSREDNRIAASGRGLNVTELGIDTDIRWARSSDRMRERILFLWGEMALRHYGVDQEMSWPQLARAADSEAFVRSGSVGPSSCHCYWLFSRLWVPPRY